MRLPSTLPPRLFFFSLFLFVCACVCFCHFAFRGCTKFCHVFFFGFVSVVVLFWRVVGRNVRRHARQKHTRFQGSKVGVGCLFNCESASQTK
ncbi:hypothetical protein TRSC58_07667 [Trypanosoma rangeli SC58]|uniref:Secreted protein n=1 Tax=Trypanosoma rangeli SC58 TaxID=429131 RepID=A0A061IRI5_TRYRA|nr:hypothetical protein TRSC58_07667 [Trypanosoma rangeli SC58]